MFNILLNDYSSLKRVFLVISTPLAKMEHYQRPDSFMMESVRKQVEEIILVFRACTQCRADAYGILDKKSEDYHLEMTPQSHY